jgi:hypothetical protein
MTSIRADILSSFLLHAVFPALLYVRTASTNGFWRRINVNFGNLPNNNEYSVLFDEFKITGVKVKFHPRITGVQTLSTASANLPITNNQFYLTYRKAVDKDVQGPLGTYSSATYNRFLELAGPRVITRPLNRPISVFFRPKIIDPHGTQHSSTRTVTAGWQNFNTIQEDHWGPQFFMHDYAFSNANSGQFGVDIQLTFYFTCRGAR